MAGYLYLAASEGHAVNTDGALDTFVRDPSTGALTQLAGAAGCTDKTGTDETNAPGSCATGIALHDADEVVVSADGKSVYVAGQGSGSTLGSDGALTAFARNPDTGVVTQLAGTAGCVSADGGDGAGGALGQCAIGRGMLEPSGLAVSPDGNNVYVATSDTPGALVTLRPRQHDQRSHPARRHRGMHLHRRLRRHRHDVRRRPWPARRQ